MAQILLSKNLNLVLVISVLLYLLVNLHFHIKFNFPGIKLYLILMLVGMIVGIINLSCTGHTIYSYGKHIYYFIFPILYWMIGDMIVRKSKNSNNIIMELFVAAFACTVYDILNSIFAILSSSYNGLHQLRGLIGNGSVYPVLVIAILVLYKDLKIKRKSQIVIISLSLLSIFIHFSRTYLLELIVIMLFSGILKNLKKSFRVFLIALIGIITAYCIVPTIFNDYIEKIIYSVTELKINSNWDYISINNNWRGYELYCELKHFSNSSVFEQLFGGGFGSTLDVFNYAYLVTDEDSLIFLHNGYGTVLMIWGCLGVIVYILWVINLYRVAGRIKNVSSQKMLKGMTVIIMIVSYFIMGLFFSEGVAIYLLIYSTIYSFSKETLRRKYCEDICSYSNI